MTDHYRIFNIGATGLLSAAIREEINVSDRLEQSEAVREIRRAVGVNDIDEMSVAGVQFFRLLPEQMMPKEWRRRIETGYTTQK